MNNLDDYNLDDDLPFSPIDDENTDKKQKKKIKMVILFHLNQI